MEDTKTHDLIVVGGGLAGLAAATYVARARGDVLLLEASRELGGRARSRVRDGVVLNQGAHALYLAGTTAAVLEELGVEVRGATQTRGICMQLDGEWHPLPTGAWSLLTNAGLPWRSRWVVAKLLARLPKPTALPGLSAAEWIAGIPDETARRLLVALALLTSYGADLERMRASVLVAQMHAGTAGVSYLHGGWQSMVDGLEDAARAAGVSIRRHAVKDVQREGDGWSVDGMCAGRVLLAVPPDVALRVAPRCAAHVGEVSPVRVACLDLALDALPLPPREFGLSLDAPLYASVHTSVARLAPEGVHVVHLVRYLDAGSPSEDPRAELEAWMDAFQPGWRGSVVQERFLPQMVVTHALPMVGVERPSADVGDGLYLAGDWVGEGILADGAMASAREVGVEIAEALTAERRGAA